MGFAEFEKSKWSKIPILIVFGAITAFILLFVISGLTQNRPVPVRDETVGELPVPDGCVRTTCDRLSFGHFLRELPLKSQEAEIRFYNGQAKTDQSARYRVVDLPIGSTDLQQCADVAMRLRADYLLSAGRQEEISFRFTSGDTARWSDWKAGYRSRVDGNQVSWEQTAPEDSSRSAYQNYLNTVFTYSGSFSLARDMEQVVDAHKVQPGDCFVQGGFPGHVVLVVDMARDTLQDRNYIMLAQGFMPAQDIHILVNPQSSDLTPWYEVGRGNQLVTPDWMFDWTDLRRYLSPLSRPGE